MLVKIFLILAILAGIAAVILGFTQVKPKIEGLQQNLVEETTERIKQTKRAEKGEKERDQALSDLKSERNAHSQTRTRLRTAEDNLAASEQRNQQLQAQINKLQGDLTAARQNLAAWDALGIKVEEVKGLMNNLAEEKRKNEVLQSENKVLNQRVAILKRQLDDLLQPDPSDRVEEGVPLPTDLKAKVVAVDPKWNFVVLDVGSDQEAREGGNMIIYRDGKLIAKVKIQSVTASSSIATIMSGWKITDVQEGDLALHRPVKPKVSQ
ncbi:MAG: hypothetical protein N3J91_04045 [Verrucomicrobiae bacterium]|nr:hypothetical protein [Verrucomicrobiae bacterium]